MFTNCKHDKAMLLCVKHWTRGKDGEAVETRREDRYCTKFALLSEVFIFDLSLQSPCYICGHRLQIILVCVNGEFREKNKMIKKIYLFFYFLTIATIS